MMENIDKKLTGSSFGYGDFEMLMEQLVEILSNKLVVPHGSQSQQNGHGTGMLTWHINCD